MTHALRQNCGSFLYDSISRDWLSEEERQSLDPVHPSQTAVMDKEGGEQEAEESVSGLPKEWPLFDSPTLSSVRVTGFVEKRGVNHFVVCPVLSGFQWTVYQPYDHFVALHRVLVSQYGVDKSLLPSRGVLGFFSQPKKSELVEMQKTLEHFLMTVVKSCPVAPTELYKFIGYPFSDILSVTQGLARFFYQQGEVVVAQDKAVQMSPLQLHCINRRLLLPFASSETGKMKDDFGHLLDFVQNLKKLKIAPPSEEAFIVREADQLTFDLSMMKSLRVLFVDSISEHQFQGRHQLPGQLEAIEVRRTVNSLKQMLVVYPPSDVEYYDEPSMFEAPANYMPKVSATRPTPYLPDYSRALKWERLRHANFKLNQMKKIDDSLQLVPFLEKLDLSYNYIEEIENLTELPHLRVLDLSHNKISNLSDLHEKMGNVKKLSLASNNLSSLSGVEKTLSLEFLDLGNNHISDVSEVGKLSKLPNLNYLILRGNQIEQSPSYRSQVFSHLPQTDERVALDGKKASIDEMYISISLSTPTMGHKRVPSRTADISLDTDEQETKEAQTEVEEGMSLTNQLEELRKEGGDKWLAILNADKKQSDDDVVSTNKSQSLKRRRRTGKHRPKKENRRSPDSSMDPEASLADLEVSMSPAMAELVATKQSNPPDSPVSTSFQVTVHEYAGFLHTLSREDLDQLLLNCQMEQCAVSVDRSLNRLVEVVTTGSKTRAQRDLALLSDMKMHEGKRLALCLHFSSFGSSSVWVVYCVKTHDALARLYTAIRRASRSRSTTPEASLALLEITSVVKPHPPSDPPTPKLKVKEAVDGPEQTLTLSEIKEGQPTTSLEPTEKPLSSLGSTGKTSSKGSVQSSPKSSHQLTASFKLTSSGESDNPFVEAAARPHSTSNTPPTRRSPIHLEEPPRSVTPDPSVQYYQEVRRDWQDDSALATATEISQASRDLAESVKVELPRKESRPFPPKLVKKPGLEDTHLASFFSGVVAQDCSEVLMSIVWGGCNLTSSPSCEIEVGLIVSNRAVYLLEVLDPRNHQKRQLSWESDSLPLACIMSSSLATLSSVSTGLFEQSVCLEFIEKGLLKSCALLPRKYTKTVAITANIRAALDSAKIEHTAMSTQEVIVSPNRVDGALFVTTDTADLLKLKEALIWPRTVTQVGNFIAVSSKSESVLSSHFETEVKRTSDNLTQKFEIVQFLIVGEISTDSLPLSTGQPHLRTRTLVLTGDSVYLCKESLLYWPGESSVKLPFPRTVVLDSHSLKSVSKIKICDRAHHVVSHTDPVYEFVIKFDVVDDPPGMGHSVYKWKLCVQDREYLNQFITCLTHLWKDLRSSDLKVVHTTDSITDALSLQPVSKPPSSPRRTPSPTPKGPKYRSPVFFASQVLLDFASLSNYQRLKFFKKHVAQAEFIKSDEIPLCAFLAHCSTGSSQQSIEIEVCILASNYAIYLLSDVECIRKWMDGGGPFSFQRMSLLSKKDSSEVRCFHRIWLNEVREIKLGLFHLSATICSSSKSDSPIAEITIHTDNQFTTVNFLSALSCTLNLQNSAEMKETADLLSDYCDLISESVSIQTKKGSPKINVECIPHPDLSIDKLKEILISISPSITRNSSIENVAISMHILCAQVMLLVEELQIRDTVSVQAKPHLVMLTNYGLYICRNAHDEYYSPSVAAPSDLRVKKWCHIDLIENLAIKLPTPPTVLSHTLHISVRASVKESGLTFLVQTSELLHFFVHMLSNLWYVRTGKHLPVQTH